MATSCMIQGVQQLSVKCGQAKIDPFQKRRHVISRSGGQAIEGKDPYEISRKELINDVDCWPDVTYINVGMYLLFAASPYTQEQLMNYKSLDCYQNFANGWVREVLCKKFGENRLLIAKVRFYNFC